jgi:DNA repair photolyase
MSKYIYQPAGKAFEYGELALNLYNGCDHGCTYCYVPDVRQCTKEEFNKPRVRAIKEKDLDRELLQLTKGSVVFLCFMCDPYQHLDAELQITRRIIQKLHAAGMSVTILTKAGLASDRDFDLLSAHPDQSNYGATLTFFDDALSRLWEQGAALPCERLEALTRAHSLGIPTWASLEPVIDPKQSLELIRMSHEFVDVYKVGKWNHNQRAAAIDWRSFAKQAVSLLDSLGNKYYIKKDLAAFLPQPRLG